MDNAILLHNTDAERSVLAACIYDNNIYTSVKDSLSEELFVDPECRKLYGIFLQFEREGKILNLAEVAMRLLSDGGHVEYFVTAESYSFSVTRQHISTLRELAIKRNLYVLCAKGMNIATNPAATTDDFQKLLADFKENISDSTSDCLAFADTVKDLQNSAAERMKGNTELGIRTGLHIFDVRYGFHAGDLVIVAGETSQGKSTLATTIARNMAIERTPIVYYSLEMGANQLTARIVARDTLIASSRLLYDKLNNTEFSNFYDTTNSMAKLPIFFDEKSKTSFEKLCSSIRAMVRRHGVRVAFIDYLQILANSMQNDNREQIIGDMARELKRIAVECDICIVALSQLSRDQNNHEPTISRLRGSGQIAEAADMVIFVYRPEVFGIERFSDGKPTAGNAQVIIAKGRNIGLAKEVVRFNAELTFFCDYDEMEAQQEVVNKPQPFDIQEEQFPF